MLFSIQSHYRVEHHANWAPIESDSFKMTTITSFLAEHLLLLFTNLNCPFTHILQPRAPNSFSGLS